MDTISTMLMPVSKYWLLTERFKDVQGFLDPIEGYTLHLLAAYGSGNGCIVEIGSLYGRSTCYLASGNAKTMRGKIVAVDTFQGSPEHQKGGIGEQDIILKEGGSFKRFMRNLAQHDLVGEVQPVMSTSLDAAAAWDGGPIRLLFIDGDHSYESSKADFLAWSPHVAEHGIIALHDISTWDGVTRFYEELLASGEWVEELSIATLRVVKRA